VEITADKERLHLIIAHLSVITNIIFKTRISCRWQTARRAASRQRAANKYRGRSVW